MPAEFPESNNSVELEHVATVLDDSACREILTTLEEPMTVSEIAAATDLPLSTTYKKLDELTDASLVCETSGVNTGGNRKSSYVADFRRIAINLDESRDLQVTIERPGRLISEIWIDPSN